MKITYDKKADALNIVFRTGKVARTLEIASEVFVDFNKEDKPLYMEIIGASEKIGNKNFSSLTIGSKFIQIPAFAS